MVPRGNVQANHGDGDVHDVRGVRGVRDVHGNHDGGVTKEYKDHCSCKLRGQLSHTMPRREAATNCLKWPHKGGKASYGSAKKKRVVSRRQLLLEELQSRRGA